MIPHEFFNRKTLTVARELLGKYLVRRVDGKIVMEKIIEVEAYVGPHDLACHSSRGRTPRCEPMYAEAGTIYVYFTYGMHWMLNIVTEKKDFPAAVLIRGLESVNGPARLTKKLKIDKNLNGLKLGKKSGLWIEEAKTNRAKKQKIIRTPRIGVTYAKDGWANKPYRFILADV